MDEPINTENEFHLSRGENLPNHTASQGGKRQKFVRPVQQPIFRTRQSAYRFMGWLHTMAETLPDEDIPSTYEEILDRIQNS